jgi:hypothetical protein
MYPINIFFSFIFNETSFLLEFLSGKFLDDILLILETFTVLASVASRQPTEMTFLVISFLLLLLGHSVAFNSSKFNRDKTRPVNSETIAAIRFVLNEIYFDNYRTVNLIDCVKNTSDFHFRDFKNAVFSNRTDSSKQYIVRMGNNTFIESVKYQKKVKNLFIIDTLESFTLLNRFFTIDHFDSRGHYLFTFINGHVGVAETEEILNVMWKKGFYNVNFMYENGGIINMTTFKPFRPDSCNDMEEVPVDTFKNGSFVIGKPEIMFPKYRFKSIYNCSVNVVTFERCPAMCFHAKAGTFSGYDHEILQELAHQFKFYPVINYLHGQQQWGTILDNGTITGGLRKLVDREAEIGIGNYFVRESRTKIVDLSVAYFNIPIVLVIPPGEMLFGLSWFSLMLNFSPEIFAIREASSSF